MAVNLDIFSRHRRTAVSIDNGQIREGRRTEFRGPRPLAVFLSSDRSVIHVARRGDRLDHLSTAFFGTPFLWWAIADYQPIDDVPILDPIEPIEVGRRIFIPSRNYIQALIAV